jgi:hypothetical protein
MNYPDIGDTVHIKATVKRLHADAYGVVSKVQARREGEWTAVELLIAGQRYWFDKAEIDYILKERNPFKDKPTRKKTPCRALCHSGAGGGRRGHFSARSQRVGAAYQVEYGG